MARSGVQAVVLTLALLMGSACATSPLAEYEDERSVPVPDPAEVDAVLFLVGDAGATDRLDNPIMSHLRREVERWSAALPTDSAVTVLFLGDNVYPEGVRESDHPDFVHDTTRLHHQIRVVTGPRARARGARAVFLAGNHDWGNHIGAEGLSRLRNQDRHLEARAARGIAVSLQPEPGLPGPVVQDVGDRARLVLLDTHRVFQESTAVWQAEFFASLREVLLNAGGRPVVVAGHHPYDSAGPHGTYHDGSAAFGLVDALKRSGALVQDRESPVYSRFRSGMREAFAETGVRPLVFAGGHDHSLQVLDPSSEDDPRTVLVSGAGSKLTPVAADESLRYAASSPGYMMLAFRNDGGVDLFVVSGDVPLRCAEVKPVDLDRCMTQARAAFRVVYSERLHHPDRAGSEQGF